MIFAAGLGAHPVGRDEAVSLLAVDHPPGRILQLLSAHEVHPAGYYLLLWAWPWHSLIGARLLSWIAALAVVPLVHAAAVRFGVARPALPALLAATSPFLAYYAVEVRMYSLLALFGAALLLAVARLAAADQDPGWRANLRWGGGLGLLVAAGLYVHYYAAFPVLGLLVVLAVRRRWRTAILMLATAGLLYLPGLVLLASQVPVFLRYPTEAWQQRLSAGELYAISGLLFGGAEYQEWGRRAALLLALPTLAGVARAPRALQQYLAGALLAPLLIGLLTTSLSARYLAASVPALLVCLGLGIEALPRRLPVIAAAAACALALGLVAYADLRADPQKPPTPQLLAQARREGALYVVNHRHFAPQAAYYAPGSVAFTFPSPRVDHVGLWAMPPGAGYPPGGGRALLIVDYCGDSVTVPAGYSRVSLVRYPNDFCVTRAAPG